MKNLSEIGTFEAKFIDIYVVLLEDQSNYGPYLYFSTIANAARVGKYVRKKDTASKLVRDRALRFPDGRVFPLTYGGGRDGVEMDKDGINALQDPERIKALYKLLAWT